MLDKEKFKKLIPERIDNDGFIVAGDTTAWENLANFLSEDIVSSIEFLENQATVDEICWVSEVFDDIAAKTQSKDFIEALHRIHDKLPEEEGKLIEPSIKFAELAIQ